MNKTVLLYTLLSICWIATLHSQEVSPDRATSTFWDQVRIGGGLGLSFGSNNTLVNISPSILYQPNEYVAFGPGLNYTYQKSANFKTSLYGGSAILLVNPLHFLQVSGELEQLRVNQSIDTGDGTIKDNFWNTSLFLGAGFRTGNFVVGARYNVLFEDRESIYADAWQPFVRVYF